VVTGEIDAENFEKLATAMAELPDVTAGPIEVDVAGVTFMDSIGLRVLVDLYQRVTAAGGTVVMTNPPQGVVRLLRVTDLTANFGVSYDDL
jgi:anti-sigma B factor antagonist